MVDWKDLRRRARDAKQRGILGALAGAILSNDVMLAHHADVQHEKGHKAPKKRERQGRRAGRAQRHSR